MSEFGKTTQLNFKYNSMFVTIDIPEFFKIYILVKDMKEGV